MAEADNGGGPASPTSGGEAPDAQRQAARRAFLLGGAAVVTLTGAASTAWAAAPSLLCADVSASNDALFQTYVFNTPVNSKFKASGLSDGTVQSVRNFYNSDGGTGYNQDLAAGFTDVSAICLTSTVVGMLPGSDNALV